MVSFGGQAENGTPGFSDGMTDVEIRDREGVRDYFKVLGLAFWKSAHLCTRVRVCVCVRACTTGSLVQQARVSRKRKRGGSVHGVQISKAMEVWS